MACCQMGSGISSWGHVKELKEESIDIAPLCQFNIKIYKKIILIFYIAKKCFYIKE